MMSTRGRGRGRAGQCTTVPLEPLSENPVMLSHAAAAVGNSNLSTGIAPTTQHISRELVQNLDASHEASVNEEISPAEGSSKTKNKRGKTRGIDLAKHREPGEKIKLGWSEKARRPTSRCRRYLNWFTTEVGVAVRNHANMDVKDWTHVPKDNKAKLIKCIRGKFDLPTDKHVNVGLLKMMGSRFSTYRSRLKKKFQAHKTLEEAIADKPDQFKPQYWDFLCELWQDDDYLARCEKNRANIGEKTSTHCAGSCAFYNVNLPHFTEEETDELQENVELNENDENRENNEAGLDLVETWLKTHFNVKKKAWVNEKSKLDYEKLKAAKEKAIADGKPLSDEQLSVLVFGRKSGYIRGLGHGPKPSASSSGLPSRAQLLADLEESQRVATEAQEKCEAAKIDALEAQKKAEYLHEQIQHIEANHANSISNLQSQITNIQQMFANPAPSR